MIFAKTGASFDVLSLYERNFKDFADGDSMLFTYPNEKITMTTGKDGNTTYVQNEPGKNLDLILRIMIASNDDLFLAGKLASQDADFPAFEFVEGRISKRVGYKNDVKFLVYELDGGVFQKNVDGVSSSAGNVDAAVSTYTIRFSLAKRSVQ